MGRLVLIVVCCLATLGCAVEELQNDQDKIRLTLLDLYTDELMDNLVRASNGLPFIHLDYGAAQANITSKDAASVSESYARNAMHMMMAAAATTVTTTRSAMNTLMGNASHDNTEVITVNATPLTTSVDAYNAYLQFLATPGSLQCGPCTPPDGTAHICRKYGKLYYWVPIEFQALFYDLALATTADRGRLLVTPTFFYVLVKDVDPKANHSVEAIAHVDTEIPNDAGTITFSDGTEAAVRVFTKPNSQFFMTPFLDLKFSNGFPFGLASLADLKSYLTQNPDRAKVKLESHQPPPPTTSQLLDQIFFGTPQVVPPVVATFSTQD